MTNIEDNKDENMEFDSPEILLSYPQSWRERKDNWDPILGLETIRNTMNELVVDIFYQAGKPPFEVPWQPEVNMYSDNDFLFVELGLPGATREDLHIHSTSDLLIIQGTIKPPPELTHGQYFIRERKSGSFSRSIPLPFQVISSQIKATFRGGLLTVTMPLKREKPITGLKVEIE
jgi:HSP20 family protein